MASNLIFGPLATADHAPIPRDHDLGDAVFLIDCFCLDLIGGEPRRILDPKAWRILRDARMYLIEQDTEAGNDN